MEPGCLLAGWGTRGPGEMGPGIALHGQGPALRALTAPSANERRGKLRSGSGAVLPAAGWG